MYGTKKEPGDSPGKFFRRRKKSTKRRTGGALSKVAGMVRGKRKTTKATTKKTASKKATRVGTLGNANAKAKYVRNAKPKARRRRRAGGGMLSGIAKVAKRAVKKATRTTGKVKRTAVRGVKKAGAIAGKKISSGTTRAKRASRSVKKAGRRMLGGLGRRLMRRRRR
jgi:hypothetical protein